MLKANEASIPLRSGSGLKHSNPSGGLKGILGCQPDVIRHPSQSLHPPKNKTAFRRISYRRLRLFIGKHREKKAEENSFENIMIWVSTILGKVYCSALCRRG